MALSQALSRPRCHASAEVFFMYCCQYRRESRSVQETAERLIAFSAEHGFPHWLAQARIEHGWAMAEQGHNEEVIAQIQEGLAAFRATGTEALRPHALCLLAEACRQTDRLDDGPSALAEALAAVDEHEI